MAQQHQSAADRIKDDPYLANLAVQHAGFCVEFLLKAMVMRHESQSTWPSRADRPELYTHGLQRLAALAGIDLDPDDAMAPYWHVVLQWQRNQGYDPQPMPKPVLESFLEAAFSPEGVATWLRSKLT